MEIIVGTDGSSDGGGAVRWAAREARLSGAVLRILTAFDWNWSSGRFTGGVTERQLAENAAEILLADARLIAERVSPGLPVICEPVIGDAATGLIAAGRRAGLLVVGSRGRGGISSLLLGSVGQHVAVHAPCSVAVVRGRFDAYRAPIAVGVHGGATPTALATAFGMADAHDAPLLAVHAYAEPAALWGSAVPPLVFDPEQARQAALADLEREVAPWRDKFPAVAVETRVVKGDASTALVEASRGAHALILGAGVRSELAGTLLGSVALRTLHHADCPVIIAREPVRAEAADS